MKVEKILELARSQLGIKQTAAGVKYNDAYYTQKGSLAAWCAVFLWWLFREAGAPELYFSGKKTASCLTLLDYYQRSGQTVAEYQPGDIIFFDGLTAKGFNGIPDHVGLCESFDGTYITTIDGNTSAANEANGGTVARRRRHKKYICGAARPNYEEEVEIVAWDKVSDCPTWSQKAVQYAVDNKWINGDEHGNLGLNPDRVWVLQVLYNAKKEPPLNHVI